MDVVLGRQNDGAHTQKCSDRVRYVPINISILWSISLFFPRVSTLLNAMELTEVFVVLGYANGLLRLMCRDTGSVYADINAHGAAITAMAYSWKAQVRESYQLT